MGALTDSRKRFNNGFSLSYSSPSQHVLDSDCITDLPPTSKRLKLSLMQPTTEHTDSSGTLQRSGPKVFKYPPLAPIRRQIHGPQICWKGFGSVNLQKSIQFGTYREVRRSDNMGNFVSRFYRSNTEESSKIDEPKKETIPVNDDTSFLKTPVSEGMSKAEYLKLVYLQENSVKQDNSSIISATATYCLSKQSANSSPLTLLTPDDDDKGKMIADPPQFGNVAIKSYSDQIPQYKILLESAKQTWDPKLSNLDFQVRFVREKVKDLLSKANVRTKEPVEEAFTPLTDTDEDMVSKALNISLSNRQEVLVTHQNSNIDITRDILQCLRDGAWLNDEVINLYFELLKEREKRDPKKFLKCHFFNTFFYKKLISGRSGYDYKAVRRWTTQRKLGYNLVDCDKVFVPIHKEIHWCLAIINIKDKKFQYLDSLGGMDTQALRILARYFTDEAKEKSEKNVDVSSWKQEFVDDLPEQLNGWDCGMFMIKYVDFYSRGFGLHFNQGHMPYFRRRTVKEILRLRAD